MPYLRWILGVVMVSPVLALIWWRTRAKPAFVRRSITCHLLLTGERIHPLSGDKVYQVSQATPLIGLCLRDVRPGGIPFIVVMHSVEGTVPFTFDSYKASCVWVHFASPIQLAPGHSLGIEVTYAVEGEGEQAKMYEVDGVESPDAVTV